VGYSFPDLSFLEKGVPAMKGHIRTMQKCPRCGGPFLEKPRVGMGCPKCKTTPNRLYLDIWHRSQRHRIFSNMQGQPISSYDQAFFLQEKINEEIRAHKFDPSHWVQGDAKKFYIPELVDQYYETYKMDWAPSNRKYLKTQLARCAKDFEVTDIREISRLDLSNMTTELKKIVAGKTLKNHLTTFRAFFGWAKEMGTIPEVPAFPKIEVTEKIIPWLNQEDQIKVFEAVPTPDRPLISFLMLHGCRPGEARAIRIKDVDLSQGMITISATWSGTELREKRKGKNSQPMRVLIHDELLPFVEERVKSCTPGAFLFVNPRTGDPYSTAALKKVWLKVKAKTGVDLRLYDATRHSFASQLVNAGVPIFSVSKYLGHSSIKMTEKFYGHADLSKMRIDLGKLSLRKVIKLTVSEPSVGQKVAHETN
jgi:integrase